MTKNQAWLLSELTRIGVGRYKGRTGRMIERLYAMRLVEYDLEPMANCGRPINIYVVKLTDQGRSAISGQKPSRPESRYEARVRKARGVR